MGVVNMRLTKVFRKLGEIVARHPKYFIISSVILAITLGTGLLRLNVDDNIETLYVRPDTPARIEREVFEEAFPLPQSETQRFNPSRATRLGRHARLVEAKVLILSIAVCF
jgi:predicted RND superfamily exporter protein